MNLLAMFTRISRTLIYPLSTTCLQESDCTNIESQLYRHSLPRCGISSKLPFAIRYSTPCYMGLSVPSYYVHQGTAHLREFIKIYDTQTKIGEQMRIGIEVSQLTIGTGRWIFDYPPSIYGPLLDNCWLKTTWLYVASRQIQIHASYPILNYVRQNDSFIMEKMVTLGLKEDELVRVNRCRLYLQVILLSDIVDAGGIHILTSYLQGRRSTTRKSILK